MSTSLHLGLYVLIATVFTFPAQRAVTNVSALLQCGGRTDRDLLCPKHSPGTGESGGDFGCLPDCQEPAATEATHGPDTGMLLTPPPTHSPSLSGPSQGKGSPRGPIVPQGAPDRMSLGGSESRGAQPCRQ